MKVFKVAYELFTWSGGEIPHIGKYGGHNWQNLGFRELDAGVDLILSTDEGQQETGSDQLREQ